MKCPPYVFAALFFVGCSTAMDPHNDELADLATPSSDDGTPDLTATDPGDMAPASCMPDLAPSVTCGRCGMAMQSCVDGKVSTGACLGEHGECATGQTIYTADKCQIRVCDKNCAWPGWSLAPGAQCAASQSCYAGPDCSRAGVRDCVNCKLGACRCPS